LRILSSAAKCRTQIPRSAYKPAAIEIRRFHTLGINISRASLTETSPRKIAPASRFAKLNSHSSRDSIGLTQRGMFSRTANRAILVVNFAKSQLVYFEPSARSVIPALLYFRYNSSYCLPLYIIVRLRGRGLNRTYCSSSKVSRLDRTRLPRVYLSEFIREFTRSFEYIVLHLKRLEATRASSFVISSHLTVISSKKEPRIKNKTRNS